VNPGKLKHEEISSKVLRAGFEVLNILGCGFLEKVYENALVSELRVMGQKVETQKGINVLYKGKQVGKYFADLIVENKIIVEIKTVDTITKIHEAQLLNYLKGSGYEVGLIMNFARPKLEWKRLVRSTNERG
jgi:GxxExxY protein